MEEPDASKSRGIEPVVRVEPAGLQSLPVERELRGAVELPLPRRHAQLPEPVDGPTEVAAAGSVRETRGDAPEARGRHCQLLRDQISLWRSRGCQWNIRMLINRGRGYKNLRYLLLKAKRMAVM